MAVKERADQRAKRIREEAKAKIVANVKAQKEANSTSYSDKASTPSAVNPVNTVSSSTTPGSVSSNSTTPGGTSGNKTTPGGGSNSGTSYEEKRPMDTSNRGVEWSLKPAATVPVLNSDGTQSSNGDSPTRKANSSQTTQAASNSWSSATQVGPATGEALNGRLGTGNSSSSSSSSGQPSISWTQPSSDRKTTSTPSTSEAPKPDNLGSAYYEVTPSKPVDLGSAYYEEVQPTAPIHVDNSQAEAEFEAWLDSLRDQPATTETPVTPAPAAATTVPAIQYQPFEYHLDPSLDRAPEMRPQMSADEMLGNAADWAKSMGGDWSRKEIPLYSGNVGDFVWDRALPEWDPNANKRPDYFDIGAYTKPDAFDINAYTRPGEFEDKYAGQRDEIMNAILDRKEFAYDPETDPMYQTYARLYAQEGDRAMRDTLGQIASRTGGMANSWAASAAQQSNNYYASKTAEMYPQLYQLAYQMYQQDLQNQRQDYSMLSGRSTEDYNRYQDQWDRYYKDVGAGMQANQDLWDHYYNDVNLGLAANQQQWDQYNRDQNLDYNKWLASLNQYNTDWEHAWTQHSDALNRDAASQQFLAQQQENRINDAFNLFDRGYQAQRDQNANTQYANEYALQALQGDRGYALDKLANEYAVYSGDSAFARQLNRDAVADSQWAQRFAQDVRESDRDYDLRRDAQSYNQMADTRNFNYQAGRDAVSDNQWQQLFDRNNYQDDRDYAANRDDAYWARNYQESQSDEAKKQWWTTRDDNLEQLAWEKLMEERKQAETEKQHAIGNDQWQQSFNADRNDVAWNQNRTAARDAEEDNRWWTNRDDTLTQQDYQNRVAATQYQNSLEQLAWERLQQEQQAADNSAQNWAKINLQGQSLAADQAQQAAAMQTQQAQQVAAAQERMTSDARSRVDQYLSAGGLIENLDPALLEQSGYSSAELAAMEHYYQTQLSQKNAQAVQPVNSASRGSSYDSILKHAQDLLSGTAAETKDVPDQGRRVQAVYDYLERFPAYSQTLTGTGLIDIMSQLGLPMQFYNDDAVNGRIDFDAQTLRQRLNDSTAIAYLKSGIIHIQSSNRSSVPASYSGANGNGQNNTGGFFSRMGVGDRIGSGTSSFSGTPSMGDLSRSDAKSRVTYNSSTGKFTWNNQVYNSLDELNTALNTAAKRGELSEQEMKNLQYSLRSYGIGT